MNSAVESPPASSRNVAPQGSDQQYSFNVTGPPPPPGRGLDWNDLNYPKGAKLFHYRPQDDLPINVAHRCNLLHANYLVAVAVLLVNIVNTIITILAYKAPWINLLYTFLNFIIFASAAFTVFYLGYLGMAMRSKKHLLYYKIAAGVMIIIGLYFMLAGGGAINGFLKDLTYHVRGYWWFAVILESLMWFAYVALSCYNLYLMIRFCPVRFDDLGVNP
ncbi:conserved hypothetical protein [Perkinsus marinus ATCC 50983]|uniref:MARVEL domain-containing protein n=1 Tax=Perkinsus marinus (strain ATCC 50983 / TXsc) TaxID=423536 RepID=C5L0D1_PERM5|nr:conserved hypothetical protein [Perkinsus marinus ATCC 50983]EER09989.1 conserved hypothetical protein [Perkinsus marinus ATCC 50983]|eukprot:XP_002778194.1 conserved hypothetical protein [Perkinsus marinus ATCC 50983]